MWYGGCPKVGSIIALDRFTIERCEVLGGDRKLGEGLQIELEQFQGDGLMQVIENYGSGDFYLERNPWLCVSFKARKQRNQLSELLRRLVWDLFKRCRTLVGNEILRSLLLFSHLLRVGRYVGVGKSSWWQSAFEVHFGSTDRPAL